MPELDMKDVQKAVQDIHVAFEAMKDANETRLAEIEAKGGADPLLTAKIEQMEADLAKASKVAEEAVLAAKRQSRIVTDPNGNEVDLDRKALDWARMNAKRHGSDIKDYGKADLDGYKAAFERFLRKDDRILSADETKALSVGSDPDGGYLVHPDMSGRISARIFDTSPVRQYASVQVISTDALEGVVDNDEISSGWVNETEARAVTDTPEVGVWRIPVHELYAKPQATQKLLDDASISVEQWLSGKTADHFARTENTAFVSGSGVGRPRGFLTYADWTTAGTFQHGAIEQFDTGVSGDFAAAPNGIDTLINALYGLKMQYRSSATWFMNRSTLGSARLEKDSNGAYIWAPGAVGQPSTLLGYPVADFEDMPDIAANSLSIMVGDLRAAYQIVDRAGMRVLRDPYSNKPYVQFYTVKRVGGDVVNFDAVKLIKFA